MLTIDDLNVRFDGQPVLPALTILLAGVAPVILLTRSIRNPHQESPHADH